VQFCTGYLGRPSAVYTTSARVTRGLSPCDHARPALKELHWLPVTYRTQYKVALPRFTVHDDRCSPMCLSEYVQPASSNTAHQRVHSASSPDFIYLRTRTKFGDRTFCVASPTVWDSVPESVRSPETLASFERSHKTYLFNISF